MPDQYWHCTTDTLLTELGSNTTGLQQEDATQRLQTAGTALLKDRADTRSFHLFLQQFKSPITLLLIASSLLSFFLGERSDAFIIISIILVSALLGFYQEKGAAGALRGLLQLVQVKTTILRDGNSCQLGPEEVVPGDIVLLNAGNTIPGDCRLLECRDLYTNEASLTGETFPVEKKCCIAEEKAGLTERNNSLFMGTHVISGTAKAVVVHIGLQTEFGAISKRLRRLQPDTEFEKGVKRLGYLLMEVTLLLVLIIFSINVFLHKPVLDSFLFSLAIAVGLTPQLLPAIISINLAKGAARMAKQSVIVKRLSAIENLGGMDVFCTDKTGTITTGKIVMFKALNYLGIEDKEVFRLAYLNAFFEKGFNNPIDQAIMNYAKPGIGSTDKIDELPYDFTRKRLSVLVTGNENLLMITKGAFDNVLAVCSNVRDTLGREIPIEEVKEQLQRVYTDFSQEGYRVLGVAYKRINTSSHELKREDEADMIFSGLLLFTDPPKAGINDTMQELKELGITLKIITGDNALVAAHIAKEIGMNATGIMTGETIREMSIDALSRVVGQTAIFAGIEPNQKEKILMALKRAGHVVGYMGDGINDAPALHVADAGISVNGAADVAKEGADIVLLGNDLRVLAQGVREGRKTFANTLKYIFMATSANFGNMFSMAGASLFMSFLPLLPKQVLLTNLLTDIPEMTIATDTVDKVLTDRPRRIDLHFIRKFMIVFGLISSVFDYATFGVLLYWLKATQAEFRTGWFLESVVSAALIVLVVRTSRAFYRNRPGNYLLLSTIAIVIVTSVLPFTPLAAQLGFVPLPLRLYLVVGGIVTLYIVTAEMAKRLFYKYTVI
jgi:Mg2+-importing ATPase